jgi:exosome complex RNA-binding protein Rrp42 (RNase PH superfamily)
MLSEGERRFVEEGLAVGVRADGRGLQDAQGAAVVVGTLPQANGSARVRLLLTGCDVQAAVKAELVETGAGRGREGEVRCAVEFWSSALSAFSGRRAAEASAALAADLQAVLSARGAVAREGLWVAEGLAWRLWVDVTILAAGGSLLAAVVMAAHLALRDAVLPALRVRRVDEGGVLGSRADVEVVDDAAQLRRVEDLLAVGGEWALPLVVPVAVFSPPAPPASRARGVVAFLDPTADEELCAASLVHVAVQRSGHVVALLSRPAAAAAAATFAGDGDRGGAGASAAADKAADAPADNAEDDDGALDAEADGPLEDDDARRRDTALGATMSLAGLKECIALATRRAPALHALVDKAVRSTE